MASSKVAGRAVSHSDVAVARLAMWPECLLPVVSFVISLFLLYLGCEVFIIVNMV